MNKEIIKEIKGKEWKEVLDKTLDELLKDAKLDGFRKGKVPKDVYLKRMGTSAIYQKALDKVTYDLYLKALDEVGVDNMMSAPSMNLMDLNDEKARIKFVFLLKPDIKLKKYKNLNVKKDKVSVSKKEINEEIDKLLDEYSEIKIKEGKAAKGDTVNLDFTGFKDGVEFPGGKAENYILELGSNTFIPGFEDEVVGLKSGEEKEFKIKFPEDYMAEELKGKEVTFKIKVNEVKEKIKRKLDKELYLDLAIEEVKDKESLEKYIENNLKEVKKADAEEKYTNDLIKEVLEHSEIEISDEVAEAALNNRLEQIEQTLMMQGMNLKSFYELTNKSEEEVKDELREETIKSLKYSLVVEALIKEFEVKISDKDIKDHLKKIADETGQKTEDIEREYGGKENVKRELEFVKAIEELKKNNK